MNPINTCETCFLKDQSSSTKVIILTDNRDRRLIGKNALVFRAVVWVLFPLLSIRIAAEGTPSSSQAIYGNKYAMY